MGTLTNPNHRVHSDTCQDEKPMWMVLHGGAGAQRYRWSEWARGVVRDLTSSGHWIAYQDGNQIELKHRSRAAH
jgi:hypothetical protein